PSWRALPINTRSSAEIGVFSVDPTFPDVELACAVSSGGSSSGNVGTPALNTSQHSGFFAHSVGILAPAELRKSSSAARAHSLKRSSSSDDTPCVFQIRSKSTRPPVLQLTQASV